jgi:TPR repeat protein
MSDALRRAAGRALRATCRLGRPPARTVLPAPAALSAALLAALLLMLPAAAAPAARDEVERLRGYAEYSAGRHARAFDLFRQAARAGVRAAQYNVAIMLLRGETGRAQTGADTKAALGWLRKSAAQRFPPAQYALGKLYEQGELLPRDLSQAAHWYLLAAEQGDVDAQLELIASHMLGRGVPKSPEQAAHWAARAAQAGDAGAQYLLASFYEHGDGVPQDLRQAFDWYQQAARNGDPGAAFKAREMAARIRAGS